MEARKKIKEKYKGVAVIFAGGGGIRLWPLSREKNPKQFLSIFDSRSFFRIVAERIMKVFSSEDVFVSTTRGMEQFVKRDFPELPKENLIIEPARKDCGPAVLYACMYINKKRGNVPIFGTWSEEIMDEGEEFQKIVLGSIAITESHNKLVRIGVRPTYPSTKFGYIQLGDFIDKRSGIELYKVRKFHEKPDIKKAKEYIKRWDFLWNSGMWATKPETMFNFYKKYAPEIFDPMNERKELFKKDDYSDLMSNIYGSLQKISIDYIINDRVENTEEEMLVIPSSIFWQDAGTWNMIYETGYKDENGNVILGSGNILGFQSKENLVFEEKKGKLIALFHMENTTLIDTGDVLLVMPTNKAEKLKDLIEEIKRRNGENWL